MTDKDSKEGSVVEFSKYRKVLEKTRLEKENESVKQTYRLARGKKSEVSGRTVADKLERLRYLNEKIKNLFDSIEKMGSLPKELAKDADKNQKKDD